MCIPCFPYSDVDFEEEPRAHKRTTQAYQYVWSGQNWVLQPYDGRRSRNVSPLIHLLPVCLILPIVLSRALAPYSVPSFHVLQKLVLYRTTTGCVNRWYA